MILLVNGLFLILWLSCLFYYTAILVYLLTNNIQYNKSIHFDHCRQGAWIAAGVCALYPILSPLDAPIK